MALIQELFTLQNGSNALQHDDPASNGEAVSWNNGDPETSGCYCQHCMAGFTGQLMSQLNTSSRARLNVTAEFNYKDRLLHTTNRTTPQLERLRSLFVTYQLNVTERYVHGLRAHVDAVAHEMGWNMTYSCNNGGHWTTPYFLFDYGLGELNVNDSTPLGLEAIFQDLPPPGKMQVMTMPKPKNVTLSHTPAFTALVRASIAYAYALGSNMMVPWDIYLPTPDAARYYGVASQYADVYQFVRDHGALLDASVVAIGDAGTGGGNYSIAHTGVGGDGERWRYPFPHTAPGYAGPRINGLMLRGQTAKGCQVACNGDAACKGVVMAGSGILRICYTLDLLDATGTGMPGDSYTRNTTRPANTSFPCVAIAEPGVYAKARRSSCSGGAAPLVTVHIVDWRRAANWSTGVLKNITFPPLNLNLSNALFADVHKGEKRPCGLLNITLHQLGSAGAVEVKGSCVDGEGTTSLSLAAPRPWSLLEVRPALPVAI